jgi:hypothetical protein
MASPELITLLQKRKQELLKELQAIDVLLAANQSGALDTQSHSQPPKRNTTKAVPSVQNPAPYTHLGYVSSRDENITTLGQKTDALSWKDYIHKAVKILGTTRAVAISDLIIDTNDHKIPDQRVKDAVNAALRTLVKEKKTGVKEDDENEKVFFSL